MAGVRALIVRMENRDWGYTRIQGALAVTVPLLAQGQLYGPRITQLDARLSKDFRFTGRRHINALLDFYNLLNVGPLLAVNSTYGPLWQTQTALLPGRFIKFGAQMDF